MENNCKEINIEEEQNKAREKIDTIKQFNVFYQVNMALNNFKDSNIDPLQQKNINIYGRLKKVSSAINKIAHKGIKADEIYDLMAYMFVVELSEDYENVKDILQMNLPAVTYSHDFDGSLSENNGYSSLHLGIDVDKFLSQYNILMPNNIKKLSAEIQVKTYGMYMAQEATHDSIYKNDKLSDKQKYDMQSLMFPLIEYLTDIEMYQKTLNATIDVDKKRNIQEKIMSLKQKVEEHKMKNMEYINENISLVENVFKEYVIRKYIETIKQNPDLQLSLEETENALNSVRKLIDCFSSYQEPEILTDTEPTGFKNIDALLSGIQSEKILKIVRIANSSKNLLEGLVNISKKSVKLSDIADAIGEIEEYSNVRHEDEISKAYNDLENL